MAMDIKSLMNLAYSYYPLEVRGSLEAQNFIDAIKDEDA